MPKTGLVLVTSAFLVFLIGLLMVFNTTSAEAIDRALEVHTFQPLMKQIIYAALGFFLGVGVYKLGYQNILRLSPSLMFVGTIFLILVFVPKIGHEINGAKRWIGFEGFTFQPSEIMKYLIPLYVIDYFQKNREQIDFRFFIRLLLILAFPICLIFLEPDNGTTIILFTTLIVLFFLYKVPFNYWAVPLAVFLLIGVGAASQMPHVKDRIKVYLHPESDLRGKGHQPYQAKIAAGSGRLFGKGLGQSLQKLNYLPEARSDYIAAIYAEEFGFLGMLVLISVYMLMAFAGFFIAFSARHREGFYVASILTFLIALQAFLNLGVVSGLLPSKGMTLPFFSLGGTALVVNIAALFLLINIAILDKRYAA